MITDDNWYCKSWRMTRLSMDIFQRYKHRKHEHYNIDESCCGNESRFFSSKTIGPIVPFWSYCVVVTFPEHTKHSSRCRVDLFPNLKQQDAVGCSGSLKFFMFSWQAETWPKHGSLDVPPQDAIVATRTMAYLGSGNLNRDLHSKCVHVHFHRLRNHPECPSRHQYAHCFWMLTGCQPLRLLPLKCSSCILETQQ